jgi:hypothetical protein
VEVVVLIKRVFLPLIAEMSDRFLEQQTNIKFCVKLSLEMKHGAFNMTPKANAEVCNGNSRHPRDPRKFTC